MLCPGKNINVVVVGPSQAGKSSLIELSRKYANIHHEIDQSKLGNGVFSHTEEVNTVTIRTNFPEYEAYETLEDVDGQEATRACSILPPPSQTGDDEEPFEEERLERHLNTLGLDLRVKEGALEDEYSVTFFDTPGLNDTGGSGKDATHLYNIHEALQRAGEVHMVIIMVSSMTALTPDLETGIRSYIETFPEFLGILAFGYSYSSYQRLCSGDEMKKNDIRRAKLNRIINNPMEATLATDFCQKPPHFVLDCIWQKNKQIRNCITFGAIREILLQAKRTQPVSIKHLQILKTPRMREVDGLIVSWCESYLATMQQTIELIDVESSRLLRQCHDFDVEILELLQEKDTCQDFILTNDNKELHLLGYRAIYEDWKFFGTTKPIHLHFAIQENSLVFITKCEIVENKGYRLWAVQGGVDQQKWVGILQRRPFQSGSFRIDFWAPKRVFFRSQITERKTSLRIVEKAIPKLEARIRKNYQEHKTGLDKVREQRNGQTRSWSLSQIAKEKRVDPAFFRQLAEAQLEFLKGGCDMARLAERTREIYGEVLAKRGLDRAARDRQYKDKGHDEGSLHGTPRGSTSTDGDCLEKWED